MKLVRPLLLVSVLLLSSSCVVMAGAGLGYVISREVLPGAVHQAHVADDIDNVWPAACESLDVLHDLGTEVVLDAQTKRAEARINGARVVVDVLAHDYERTVVQVRAEGTFSDDPKMADRVMQNILERLERESVGARTASAPRR